MQHIIETTVTCNIYNYWVHVIHLGRLSCSSDDCLEQRKSLWSAKKYKVMYRKHIVIIKFHLIYLHCWTCLRHLFHNTWITLARTLRFVWHASNSKYNNTLVSVGERENLKYFNTSILAYLLQYKLMGNVQASHSLTKKAVAQLVGVWRGAYVCLSLKESSYFGFPPCSVTAQAVWSPDQLMKILKVRLSFSSIIASLCTRIQWCGHENKLVN